MAHRNRTEIRANWGDCDAAGIIFYPVYFRWFDECTQALLRSVGLDQRSLRDEFGIVGTAAVDASARFTAPVTYGDLLRTTSFVERWGTSSFTVVPSPRRRGGRHGRGRTRGPHLGEAGAATAGSGPNRFRKPSAASSADETRTEVTR